MIETQCPVRSTGADALAVGGGPAAPRPPRPWGACACNDAQATSTAPATSHHPRVRVAVTPMRRPRALLLCREALVDGLDEHVRRPRPRIRTEALAVARRRIRGLHLLERHAAGGH